MKDTRKIIIEAAIEIFKERGKHGARMEEIAIKAGVNKAMVYYYFSSKDNLFKEVVHHILNEIHDNMGQIIEQRNLMNSEDPEDLIRDFIKAHFSSFSYQSQYSKILIDALFSDSDEIREAYLTIKKKGKIDASNKMFQFFETGKLQGRFRDIDYSHIMISLMGMSLVYFITKPIAQTMLNLNIEDEEAFLKKREDSIIDLLLNGIKEKDL